MSLRNRTRKASSGTIRGRKSMAVPSSLSQELLGGGSDNDNDGPGDAGASSGSGMHSLAHELAVALMPEPSASSKMLQEEFGIEFDEGAEGIDEQPTLPSEPGHSLADEIDAYADTTGGVDDDGEGARTPTLVDEESSAMNGITAHFGSGVSPSKPANEPKQDPMDILAKDLESTDRFLTQLRHIDGVGASGGAATTTADSSTQSSSTIEKYASEVIRHINDSVRDREGQVRELLEYEREFRRIAGEVNGNDVLGRLDPLPEVEGLSDRAGPAELSRPNGTTALETIQEDVRSHQRAFSNDWETNPDDMLEDEEEDVFNEDIAASPMNASFVIPPPPSTTGPPTVAKIIPEIIHVRTLTSSLASSLTAISEHAQVNGAANADAGRKIRALKNKLGGWRSEWDSAEQSRLKIERWEAGLTDGGDKSSTVTESTSLPLQSGGKRFNARRITEEHLRAFELALVDAGMKTQAIMAQT